MMFNCVIVFIGLEKLSKADKLKLKKIQEFDLLEGEDELGVPLKDIAAHNLMVELAEFISKEIDATFGVGTSENFISMDLILNQHPIL